MHLPDRAGALCAIVAGIAVSVASGSHASSETTGATAGSGNRASDTAVGQPGPSRAIDVGSRPGELLDALRSGELKSSLQRCDASNVAPSRFSIAHRGAPLRLPEHSREGYLAAIEQGAGIVECDVTFTRDAQPVCRHSQCDLHTTTDILATDLAASCSTSPNPDSATPYRDVRCCTSDLTLDEFSSLRAKRDGGDPSATSARDYLAGTPGWTGHAPHDYGTLMTLPEFVALVEPTGVAMTPELKAFEPPNDDPRFDRAAQSRRLFDTFRTAGVEPDRLYPQSFELDDIRRWRDIAPDYAPRAVWLDGRYRTQAIDPDDASSLTPAFDTLAELGVGYLAPPIWMLLTLDEQQRIVPSDYAIRARDADVPLLTWSLERGADGGGGFYYQSIASAYTGPADQLRVLDVLANQVGVDGVFSDWPATTTWFAHCNAAR